MVKELMQTNKMLRDTVDTLNETNERFESESYTLQLENRDLRDRIEILESVIAATTQSTSGQDLDSLDWRQLILEEE
jgi:regulator of replication initiation timing